MPKSKKTLKVKSRETKSTTPELKKAYQLVTKDLFNQLVKAKDGDRVTVGTLGSLGSFYKAERKVKSGITPLGQKRTKKLNIYVYYRLLFKPSRKLKEELNKPLVKKYS
jgi:nucleoid DNA-binding protein